MKLLSKRAIVTGGAMGNGLGIVEVFLNHGAEVIILDYAPNVMDVVAKLISEGKKVIGYQVDIRNKQEVTEIIERLSEEKPIDILVNNAGVAKLEPFVSMSDEVRDYQFDINIRGTWNVTQAVVKSMIKQQFGSIVNLSSVTGPMVADAGEVAYATTKAAVLGFTKALAMELVKDHIRVNAILPGYIMTPMVEGIARDTDSSNPNKVIDGIASGIPMGRLGTIQELGELAAFLASDEASYITGQGIVIDGGSTLPETASVGV